MIKLYIAIFIIGLISSIGYGAYATWNNMQDKIELLKENNAKLEMAVQTQTETIKTMEKNVQAVNAELNTTNKELRRTRTRNKILAKKIEQHDMGMLGAVKPALVERVINKATVKSNRCFELMSGAEFTEKERSAKNAKSFNSECPWLYDDFITSGRLLIIREESTTTHPNSNKASK